MNQRTDHQPMDRATSRAWVMVAMVLVVTLALIALPSVSPHARAVDDGTGATPIPGEVPPVIDPTSTPNVEPPSPTEPPAPISTAPSRATDTTETSGISPSLVNATVYPTRPSHRTTPPPKNTPTKKIEGAVTIDPNRKQNGDPGMTVTYQHVVTNVGKFPDIVNLTGNSAHGWVVRLLTAGGSSPLTDHDGDGLPDTGPLAPGERQVISVAVTIPPAAPARTSDFTTITARSSIDPNGQRATDRVKDTTKVNRILTLAVNTDTVDFGEVAADGTIDPGVTGVLSTVDDQGAYYIVPQAVRVTIVSNDAWTGSCQASENVDSSGSPTVRVGNGRLEWRLAGTDTWIPFTTKKSTTCFPSPPTMGGDFTYDIRLRVEKTDQPGTFRSIVTFVATP